MSGPRKRPAIGAVLASMGALCLGFYFTFAAVQGDFGVFRRVQASAEKASLAAERDRLKSEVVRMENLTRRLSDSYLDLDLLDERARDVLGLVRADEIVIH
jgi:cell division protein FtsB